MAGALLRSGSLREFHPLGAVGNPVFSAASQLRAAMRRLIGADIADLFAIPRQHDAADTIDWYAPEAGDVVPWAAATTEQREAARATLQAARERLAEHSRTLQAHDSSERQVFGRLLGLVTQIPNDDHIYIVGGRPVLTFWGFHPLDAPPGLDVIGTLDASRPVPPPPAAMPVTPPPPITAEPRRRRWWWWLLLPLLLLLLLLLLAMLLRSCGAEVPWLPGVPIGEVTATPTAIVHATPPLIGGGHGGSDGGATTSTGAVGDDAGTPTDAAPGADTPASPPDATPPADAPPDSTPPADQPSPPPQPDERATPTTASTPPGSQPTTAQTPPGSQPTTAAPPPPDLPTPAAPQAQPPPPVPQPAGTPLTIPDEAVRQNSTDFLNGQWRSITGLQDRKGNPVELNYDFNNGQGMVSLHRSVGDKQDICSGRVGSTLKDGTLVINQSGVRCPDGSAFQDAKVECSVGAGGKAVCRGVNSDGTTYDVNIVK